MKPYFAMLISLTIAASLFSAAACIASAASFDLNSPEIRLSLINQNPDPARAGEVVELRFMAENLGGGQANNIRVDFQPSYPFIAVASENYTKYIGLLQGFQQDSDSAIIKFNVLVDKDSTAGTGKARLRVTDERGNSATEDVDVSITSKEFAQVICIDKSQISPGNQTNLTFTVNNIGNSPLRNMVFSWNDPKGVILPIFSDDTKYIKSLDTGGSADLTYQVAADVNAAPGLYMLNLNLKFDMANGTTSQLSTKAGIFVGGQTDFDIAYSDSTNGQTSLSIANTGNNPAYSVTVMIPDQEGFSVSGSSSSIIGNLDKGDYTIVTFQLMPNSIRAAGPIQGQQQYQQGRANDTIQRQFSGNASFAGNLRVEVDYTDTIGTRHSLGKQVRVQSSQNSTATAFAGFRRGQQADYTLPVAITIIVCIGSYVFYRRRKKRKLRKGGLDLHEAREGRKSGA